MEGKAIKYSEEINKRFFKVIDSLIATGRIEGLKTFCDQFGFHRIKYSNIRNARPGKQARYKYVDAAAVGFLIRDFDVSPEWLFKGKGEMFNHLAIVNALK